MGRVLGVVVSISMLACSSPGYVKPTTVGDFCFDVSTILCKRGIECHQVTVKLEECRAALVPICCSGGPGSTTPICDKAVWDDRQPNISCFENNLQTMTCAQLKAGQTPSCG